VIHAAHHEQELPQYGGLIRKIPITGITFGIAVLAIAGFGFFGVGLSGYYSKDLILAHAAAYAHLGEGHSRLYPLLFWVPFCIAAVTSFYMTRCWMLTFWGKPRNQHLYDHAHESPVLYGPLVALAILSVVGGWGGIVSGRLENAIQEGTSIVKSMTERPQPATYNLYSQAWKNPEEYNPKTHVGETAIHASHFVHSYVWLCFVVGIGLGVVVYWNGYAVANRLMKITPLKWIHAWLYRRMLFDELYMGVFVVIVLGLSRLSRAFDTYIIDGLVNLSADTVRRLSVLAGLNDRYVVDGAVNGVASATQGLGAAVRTPQSGRIRLYVTVLLGLIALGVTAAVVIVFST
jgi:NADH-quinone oxidoreductase subunit L